MYPYFSDHYHLLVVSHPGPYQIIESAVATEAQRIETHLAHARRAYLEEAIHAELVWLDGYLNTRLAGHLRRTQILTLKELKSLPKAYLWIEEESMFVPSELFHPLPDEIPDHYSTDQQAGLLGGKLRKYALIAQESPLAAVLDRMGDETNLFYHNLSLLQFRVAGYSRLRGKLKEQLRLVQTGQI